MTKLQKITQKIQSVNLLSLSVVLITLSLIAIVLLPGSKNQLSYKPVDLQSVPEVKDILSKDQETRLKGARTLVERVGVDDALEIVKNLNLPATGESHLAVHQIGFHAYKVYGVDSILHCKDYYLYACYHGAIIEAASDEGIEVIKKMTDKCKDVPTRYFQCVHAAGHSILAIWNYDLPNALKTCDELFEKNEAYPSTLSSCHNGSFMENLFGVHDWGTANSPKKNWLKDKDPYFPCTAFGEKYQKGCWLNQAARIYQLNNGNLSKTATTCQKVANGQHRDWCFDNLARQIHPLTEGNVSRVFDLCKSVGSDWETKCITVNAGAYASVGDPPKGIAICNLLNQTLQNDCYGPILDYVTSDGVPNRDQIYLCYMIVGNYAQNCLSKITS